MTVLAPQIEELTIGNVVNVKTEEIKDMIKDLTTFESNAHVLDQKLAVIKSHNLSLKEALPQMDAQYS